MNVKNRGKERVGHWFTDKKAYLCTRIFAK